LIHHRQLKGQCVVLLRSLNPLIHLTFLSDEQKGVNLIQDGSQRWKRASTQDLLPLCDRSWLVPFFASSFCCED
ncbi:hypothetical protein, partial [Acidovorax sp. SUPP1855]|uniref:hypothetical protein n=1 Tax=Acidovorax sp. SUPP1855 TaxID=431774 RepID=UPI0024E0864E